MFVLFTTYHGLCGASPVLTAILVWPNFDPYRIETPRPIAEIFVTGANW